MNSLDIKNSDSKGLKISLDNNELVIKGSKQDLIELSDYILNMALSECDNDHLHLDELSLIDNESSIKNIIIEKVDM